MHQVLAYVGDVNLIGDTESNTDVLLSTCNGTDLAVSIGKTKQFSHLGTIIYFITF